MKLKKLILFYILINLFCYNAKITKKQINCIADFLLFSRNIQTEIFAKKNWKEWKIQRGISENIAKDIKINKSEIKRYNVFDEYTEKCLKMIEKLIGNNKNVLEVKNIFDKIKNKYLILSENYQKKLEEQSFCLANFLFKNFGANHLFEDTIPTKIKEGNDAINNYFRISSNKVLFWNWQKTKLPKGFQLNLVYKEGTEEFYELNKCNKILKVSESTKIVTYENKEKLVNFNKIYRRFNQFQFYFDKIPNSVENIIIEKSYVDICDECSLEFEEGEKIIQLIPCKHKFHKHCIQDLLDKNDNKNGQENDSWLTTRECPFCHNIILIVRKPEIKKIEEVNEKPKKSKNKFIKRINRFFTKLL
ncbi:hypothetical protein ACQ4LE_010729 [Meloidogyne hapla]